MIRRVRVWVHPTFHRRVKIESSIRGITIEKYTELLAKKKIAPGNSNEREDDDGLKIKGF